jgi:hypothetical protein
MAGKLFFFFYFADGFGVLFFFDALDERRNVHSDGAAFYALWSGTS